jgi:hypothetical protein
MNINQTNMKKFIFTALFAFLFAAASMAQEGMWLLSQIDQLGLESKGLQIKTGDIYKPGQSSLSQAVVQLGGGTASFVSPEGLLVTNHHVAYTALQRSSSVNDNYLSDGYLAQKKSDEIQAQGYTALLMQEMKDVTEEVLAAARGITDPSEKEKKINEKVTEMTQALEKDKKDVKAIVSENYNGGQYILYIYKEFKDIRIVYSPPLAIGKFGGEIDNWMWPRHTGDFSFMRVYVAPDGTGAEYNEANVPYKPKVWLKVAKDDLKDGDFAFVVGYPGFTTRYRSSNSADWNLNFNYPFSIMNFSEIISLLDETTKDDPEGALKVASLRTGLANVLKNYQGKVDGMTKTNFVQKKLDFEKEFIAWASSDPARKTKYADLISDEKKQYDILAKTKERDNVFGVVQGGLSGTLIGVAGYVYNTVREMEKPEGEKQPGFNESAIQEAVDNLQYNYAGYYEPADKAMLVRMLKMVNNLPKDQRITGLEYIFKDKSKSIEQFVDEAYKSSKLADVEFAKTLFHKSVKDLEALNDPFITMVAALYPMSEEIQKANQEFGANVTEIRKKYIDALYEWKGSALYPDANGTIRFTYGNVKGYSPADAIWYYPFTSLKGVIQKNTGKEPFDVPPALVDLYNNKDYGRWADPELKDVPVAFTHMADITGGNSGSPVMNAKGEIIGVVFDGNYEAMISDWQYDYDIQRAISVDIRYVLFIAEKFSRADSLLKEMGVSK